MITPLYKKCTLHKHYMSENSGMEVLPTNNVLYNANPINISFTPYKISTITCNTNIVDISNSINCKIDLELLFKNIDISDNDDIQSFVWVQYFHNKIKYTRGIYPQKKRRSTSMSKNKKRKFDNQVSFIFKMADGYYPNMKVFQNGNIQMTGARSIDDTTPVIKKMIEEINKTRNILLINEVCDKNFIVRMINTDFTLYKNNERCSIKRRKLHSLLIKNDQVIAWFDPCKYHGVKVDYWWYKGDPENNGRYKHNVAPPIKGVNGDVKRVAILLFESGKIIITGAISMEQLDEVYSFICKFIHDNADDVISKIKTCSS